MAESRDVAVTASRGNSSFTNEDAWSPNPTAAAQSRDQAATLRGASYSLLSVAAIRNHGQNNLYKKEFMTPEH